MAKSILGSGGTVTYDWQVDSLGNPTGIKEPQRPQWTTKWLDQDYFQSIRMVRIRANKEITDDVLIDLREMPDLREVFFLPPSIHYEQFALVGGLTQITSLGFESIPLTDAGISKLGLQSFRKLETLSLDRTSISNEALGDVKNLLGLKQLSIEQTSVDDRGIAHLRSLTKLRVLNANFTHVHGAGLKGFQRLEILALSTSADDGGLSTIGSLSTLKVLGLSWSKTSDLGLREVARLEGLNELFLDETAITDRGLGHLASLKKLTLLTLASTRITDQGLQELENLKSLRTLSLYRCPGVTTSGIKRLKQLNPSLTIYR